jgi:hypothetical protein
MTPDDDDLWSERYQMTISKDLADKVCKILGTKHGVTSVVHELARRWLAKNGGRG